MKEPIYCDNCDKYKLATYSIQPEGGTIKYLCAKHYNLAIKQLQKLAV